MDKLDLIKLGMMHSLQKAGVKGDVTLKLAQTMMGRRKKKEDEEDGVAYKTPLTALGLTAAGYGMKRLGDAALTPEDRSVVNDMIALKSRLGAKIAPGPGAGIAERVLPGVKASPDMEGSSSLFYDYIDRASRAARVKIFGKPVVPLIHSMKKVLGVDPPPPPGTILSAKQIEDLKHYPAFESGPVDAYAHQVRKNLMDEGWNPWAWNWADKGGEGYPGGVSAYIPKFDSMFEEYKKQIAPGGIEKLNHGQQMDLIRGFRGWMSNKDPEMGKLQTKLEANLADNQRWSANSYASGAEKAVEVGQDLPRTIGKGLMIAGGTLGTMWLAKKLMDMRKARQQKEKEHQLALAAHRKQYSDNHPSLLKAAAPSPTAIINGAKTVMTGVGYGDRIVGDGKGQGFYKSNPLEAGAQVVGDLTTAAKFIPGAAENTASVASKLAPSLTKVVGPALKAVGPAATIYSYGKGAVNAAMDPKGTYNAVDNNLKDTGDWKANTFNTAIQGYSDPIGTMAATGMAAKGLWDARKELANTTAGSVATARAIAQAGPNPRYNRPQYASLRTSPPPPPSTGMEAQPIDSGAGPVSTKQYAQSLKPQTQAPAPTTMMAQKAPKPAPATAPTLAKTMAPPQSVKPPTMAPS